MCQLVWCVGCSKVAIIHAPLPTSIFQKPLYTDIGSSFEHCKRLNALLNACSPADTHPVCGPSHTCIVTFCWLEFNLLVCMSLLLRFLSIVVYAHQTLSWPMPGLDNTTCLTFKTLRYHLHSRRWSGLHVLQLRVATLLQILVITLDKIDASYCASYCARRLR